MSEKIDLLNYIYSDEKLAINLKPEISKPFFTKMKKYLLSKQIVSKGITGIIIFNGPSRIDNVNVYILDDKKWIPAKPEDNRDLLPAILEKYRLKTNLNKYVGFMGFENNNKYMVYKTRDTENKRSTGFQCGQSGKTKIIKILNEIELDDKHTDTKVSIYELCVRQEFVLRSFELQHLENKTWFLDTETAIINEFEKKEKGKK